MSRARGRAGRGRARTTMTPTPTAGSSPYPHERLDEFFASAEALDSIEPARHPTPSLAAPHDSARGAHARGCLPARTRAVPTLQVSGHSYGEIAARLQMSERTVERQLLRAQPPCAVPTRRRSRRSSTWSRAPVFTRPALELQPRPRGRRRLANRARAAFRI